jgi:hypothetical protein
MRLCLYIVHMPLLLDLEPNIHIRLCLLMMYVPVVEVFGHITWKNTASR